MLCLLEDTDSLRDVLVAEVVEVSLLLHVAQNTPTLRLHPALGHQVQLRLNVYGLHLCVIVIVCWKTGKTRAKKFTGLDKNQSQW